MNLSEQFRSKVFTVRPNDTLRAATEKMLAENVGAVVVVENGQVVGILTDRDVARCSILCDNPGETPVSEVMTHDVVTIWDDLDLLEATQYFQGHQVRRLPIVDRDNHLVGMVTLDDVLTLLSRELFNISKAIAPALGEPSQVRSARDMLSPLRRAN